MMFAGSGSYSVLMIVPEVPFPPDHGGRTTIFNFLVHLKQMGMRIHLRCICTQPFDQQSVDALLPYVATIKVLTAPKRSVIMTALAALLSPVPHIMRKYWSEDFFKLVDDELQHCQYDLIHVEHYYCAQFVRTGLRIPKYLSTHNLEFEFYEQEGGPLRRLFNALQRSRVHKQEWCAMRRFNAIGFVSQRDRERMLAEIPELLGRTYVVPRGIDLEKYTYSYSGDGTRQLCFVGTLDFHPNSIALRWFLETVFPRVCERVPGVSLCVVGRNPPADILRLHDGQKIIVTGTVAETIPYIRASALFVAPFLSVAGVKMKLLEAAALGIPIVGPPAAVQGLPLSEDDYCCISREVDWADKIGALLCNAEMRQRLSVNARRKVEENCRWDASAKAMNEIYTYIASGQEYSLK
jgi:polysaccharide biosynthesis protein PslH